MSGNFSDWVEASKEQKTDTKIKLFNKPTHEIYSEISKLGLTTVKWKYFSPENQNQESLDKMLSKVNSFIAEYNPCLFIYEPRKNQGLSKDFLFDVKDFKVVKKWLEKNKEDLFKYNYLVTSMTINQGQGFVGSVYSNGKGKMIVETYHEPKVSNQRVLSQSKTNTKFIDNFVIDEGSLISTLGTHLTKAQIRSIRDEYFDVQGYFEFIRGTHLGKIETTTIGYEFLAYPENLHEILMCVNSDKRLFARLKR